MATLGLGIIIYIVFNETVELTGGPSGLSGIPNLSIGSLVFDSDVKNYLSDLVDNAHNDPAGAQPGQFPGGPCPAGRP